MHFFHFLQFLIKFGVTSPWHILQCVSLLWTRLPLRVVLVFGTVCIRDLGGLNLAGWFIFRLVIIFVNDIAGPKLLFTLKVVKNNKKICYHLLLLPRFGRNPLYVLGINACLTSKILITVKAFKSDTNIPRMSLNHLYTCYYKTAYYCLLM